MPYDNEGRFVLFTNDKKQNDKHPDRRGHGQLDGRKFYIDGWINSKDGKKYLSGTVKWADETPPTGGGKRGSVQKEAPIDENDIPW